MSDEAKMEVDVLIVGAGPVGLNLAYQLRRFSSPPIADPSTTKPISVRIIESLPKPAQETFGRAVTFWPRSMEILSQLDLADPILQQCVAVRSSAAYDEKGNETFGRGWSFLEAIADTRYKFASVLRQKHVEDIFRAKLKNLGVEVEEGHEFLDLDIMEDVPEGEKGRVQAKILDKSHIKDPSTQYTVSCRYLIGCDGTRTVVRGAAGIESDGSRTEDKWVRVDGVLKSTTMPKPNSYGSLESPIYGNVLWIPLDHGATRIGFALREDRLKLYEGRPSHDMFVKEALLSVQPFEAEFERVDWASIYSVGQRLARSFSMKGSVFIAGDAAHSHSSGAGQGMNTGVYDAANLGWKLALVLTGALKREVLETYDLERRPNASKLIKYDEDISTLITGRLPPGWKGNNNPSIALGNIFKEAAGFNTGLSIGYDQNVSIWPQPSTDDSSETASKSLSSIPTPAIPGYRAPDVQLLLPALWEPVWLQQVTVNVGKFYVVTFIGSSKSSREAYTGWKSTMEQNIRLDTTKIPMIEGASVGSYSNECAAGTRKWPVEFLTILPGKVGNAWTDLGTSPLGNVYYDTNERNAGKRYEVDLECGTSFILRPDGFIGAIFSLTSGSAEDVISYFSRLLN